MYLIMVCWLHSRYCVELHNWFLPRRPKTVKTVRNRFERQSYLFNHLKFSCYSKEQRSHQRDYLKRGSKNAKCGHNKHTVKQNNGNPGMKHHHLNFLSLSALTKYRIIFQIHISGMHKNQFVFYLSLPLKCNTNKY